MGLWKSLIENFPSEVPYYRVRKLQRLLERRPNGLNGNLRMIIKKQRDCFEKDNLNYLLNFQKACFELPRAASSWSLHDLLSPRDALAQWIESFGKFNYHQWLKSNLRTRKFLILNNQVQHGRIPNLGPWRKFLQVTFLGSIFEFFLVESETLTWNPQIKRQHEMIEPSSNFELQRTCQRDSSSFVNRKNTGKRWKLFTESSRILCTSIIIASNRLSY